VVDISVWAKGGHPPDRGHAGYHIEPEHNMSFSTVSGGYTLSKEDEKLLLLQRAITQRVNDQFIQVGATFLKQSSKNPYEDNWFKMNYRDTNLQSWIDDENLRYYNLGFNLQMGWMDVDIDAEDPDFNRAVIAAMRHLNIDTRFAFGRLSVGYPSHVFLQLGEEESANFDALTKFEPKEFKIDGKRYHVQLRSFPTNVAAANLAKTAKQTVVPGSIYSHKFKEGTHDISVWFVGDKPASNIREIAATTPRRVNFNEIVRAIAFGTVAYCLRDQWVEGSRQVTAQKVGGWLARVVAESRAMNNHEAVSADVFCPVDDDSIAESLLHFICEYMGDDEKHMRVRVYNDAVQKLERNPDAKIPGWPSMEQLLGGAVANAMRAVLMPGSDVSQLTKMADRYIYDETDDHYIDRERFKTNGNYVHPSDQLARRHKGDVIRIGGKSREAFKAFESSDMRKRVGARDLYPELNPGGIYRIGSLGDILSDDDDDDETALAVFNTWRGWPIQPTTDFDPDLMTKLIGMFDTVLGYLTQDNEDQIAWIKEWYAWTFQHPGDKQQIAWCVIGEQGVGKSWVGNIWTRQMMGNLWGSASPKVLEGDFNIGPFKDKMFVFIDEAKFHNEQGVDEVKKLIRGVDVPGMEKFMEARNYRLFSRIMFASNRLDLGIGQANTTDRALFYTRAYDREYKKMTEMQFRSWAETLKPFFVEFTNLMSNRSVREHFMRYFLEYDTDKFEVESIKRSSSNDAAIVISNMNWARRIAKFIVEDGRIHEDMDISYPFTVSDLNRRVAEVSQELGMRNVQGARVLAEFEHADVLEKIVSGGQKKLRFKYKIGQLTEEFGEYINAPMESRFVFDAEKDYGPNDCDGKSRPPWRGAKTGIVKETRF
jgi:hypothetical protein